MKKFLSFTVLAAAALQFAPMASAQEADVEIIPPANDIYTHDWKTNWYIQLGAGAQMPIFERNDYDSTFESNKITAVYEVGVGHWFSPWFGFRFRGQGGAAHWENGNQWGKMKYANLNLELTWDMLNSICGVNDKRVFSIIPYVGVGGTYGWDYNRPEIRDNDGTRMDHQGIINGSFGIDFRFRLNKRVDLYVDARALLTSDNINSVAWKTGVDPILSLTGGLSINLGKDGRHTTKYVPFDCSGTIRDLNNKINDLRGDLADTEARLRAAEAQLPCPEVKEAAPAVKETPAVNPAIRFKFNSAKVSDTDKATLYDVAQILKANPDTKIAIKGYADKRTGTSAYNQKLSERRANAVKDILVGYGVDADRMTIDAFGDSEQPYTEVNNWNRVVIMTVK